MKLLPIALAVGGLSLTALVAAGCGRPPEAPGTSTDQVANGGPLYVAHCAKCHGPAGRGIGNAPPVVGKASLPLNPPPSAKHRIVQFRTAKDVLDFIRSNMPADNPGSLSDTQYADILAFDLKLNGVDLHHLRVNEETAASIAVHPEQDTFSSDVVE